MSFVWDIDYVNQRVAEIEAMKGDDEVAHDAEDRLRREFLQWVALVAPSPWDALAKTVLETEEIEFARWCA